MFIDESGDLGSQSKHLIFSALLVKDEQPLKRIIKNMRRNKFQKELKKANEIKGNKSSPELVKYMIKKLNEVPGAKVFYITLEKEKCNSIYLNDHKHKLYNYVAGWMAKNIILEECDVVVRIDKSKTKQILRDDFDKYFESKLKENCSLRKVEIHHSNSHSWGGLQFADILAWAAFQKVENQNGEFISELTIEKEIYAVWK
ncbi:MAG: DUF3800 domain-containing protein [Methanolobus sp.]|nr:DUF3800 domain-containing protein [Methanolobus sp.]